MERTNIVLIGMPGAGKSTVGVLLAKELSKGFLDTDVLIQEREDRSLQSIMDSEGYLALRAIEEKALLTLDLTHHVIATGGSAAYSQPAMEHLRRHGIVVFLYVSPGVLLRRIRNFATRGIAKRPEQTWDDLYQERLALYKTYADITIECGRADHEAVCEQVKDALTQYATPSE
jgi:shikimate kinase